MSYFIINGIEQIVGMYVYETNRIVHCEALMNLAIRGRSEVETDRFVEKWWLSPSSWQYTCLFPSI